MRAIFLLLASSGLLLAVNSRQVVVTPQELTGYGDFDGDGDLDAIVVQRATGLYRVAFQQGDGSMQWSQARPCGLPSADALTCGPIRVAGKDSVVLAGRLANQMVLVEPALSATTSTTEQLLPSGLGPTTVAALELPVVGNDPALMDLIAHTAENSSPDVHKRHVFKSLSTSTEQSKVRNVTVIGERGTRIRHTAAGNDYYAAMLRGASDDFRVYLVTTTNLPVKQTITGLRSGSEYLTGSFSGTVEEHALIYLPGEAGLQVCLSNGASLQAPVMYSLEAAIESITPFGADSFFVIYEGGTQGRIFTLNSSGSPEMGQLFGAPLDSRLTGTIAINGSQMSLLMGDVLDGGLSTFSFDFEFNGNEWKKTGTTTLPAVGSRVALTNVLLYDGEPLIDPGAKLIETIQVPDWTSGLVISPGGDVMVTPETFTSESGGLNAGGSLSLTPKTSPTHVVGNQSEDAVSLLSLQTFVGLLPPQVTVAPVPGKYTTEVSPTLTTPDATTDLFYRFAGDTTWQSATSGAAISSVGDTLSSFTLEYYATSAVGGRSPIYQASYSYYGEPGDLDSDGDGVPDFVEIANGLDPRGGKDQDNDAVDDLYELLLGTDPNDIASTPPTPLSLNLQNSFDLAVTPVAQTALNVPAWSYGDGGADSPTDLYLHTLEGALIGHEVTRGISGYSQPTALFEKVPATDRDLFLIISTSPTFPIRPIVNSDHGREMVALIPVPYQSVGEFSFSYDGVSSTTVAAGDWLAAAQNHYLNLERSTIDELLTPDDNLTFLLVERLLREYLRSRDSSLPDSQLSLTSFRDSIAPTLVDDAELGRPFSATTNELLSLQDWVSSSDRGYLLQDIYEAVDKLVVLSSTAEMQAMKKLSTEIAYYSDFVNPNPNASPGLYPNPFDTLRGVIAQLASQSGQIDGAISLPGHENGVGYANDVSLTNAEFAAADSLLVQLLASVSSRTTTTLTLTVGADSFQEGQVPLLFTTSGLPHELYRSDGTPYLFQEPLPAGSELEVVAFNDRAHLTSNLGTPLDVISAKITSVSQPSFVDSNFNALDDEWEFFFFGQTVNPFADPDGDGYSNLQELLEDTNPVLASSFPSGDAIPLAPPNIQISRLSNGNLELKTEFPSLYSEHIRFTVLSQSDLALPFQKITGLEANDIGTDLYRLEAPLPSPEKLFFRFRLELVN